MYQDHLRWSEALMFWRKESLDNDRLQMDRCDRRLLTLNKCVTGRLDAGWRRTDRHRDELEQLKESVQALEGRVLVLESKKIALELGITGGKGCFTQWGNGEFIVITEAIHPHFTQWGNYDYFSNVPTNLPTFYPVGKL